MAFGSGHSFGALGDDDLLDAPAGADEALDRAAELVRLVDAMHSARGTAGADSTLAQLQHALAAIVDASIIRTTRVDVAFPVRARGACLAARNAIGKLGCNPSTSCATYLAFPRRVTPAKS